MWLLLSMLLAGDIQQFPGAKPVPHERFIRVVSEADSPIERLRRALAMFNSSGIRD